MRGCLAGCTGRLLLLALLAGAALAGWRWGPQVAARVRGWVGGGERPPPAERRPGPELADTALARIETLRESGRGERLALDALELQSLLRYELSPWLPEALHEPQIRLKDGRALLSARVPIEYLPRVPDLNDLISFFPDTVPLRIEVSLIPLPGRRLGLRVDGIEAARIPLPRRTVPRILDALGRRPEPDVPANALGFALPGGVGAAYIVGDTLFLISER